MPFVEKRCRCTRDQYGIDRSFAIINSQILSNRTIRVATRARVSAVNLFRALTLQGSLVQLRIMALRNLVGP